MTVTPIINIYPSDLMVFPPIQGSNRLTAQQVFNPPVIKLDDCTSRLETVEEFTAYYEGILSTVNQLPNESTPYEEAWIGMAIFTITSLCDPGYIVGMTYVTRGSIVYRIKKTYGIWTGINWTISYPPRINRNIEFSTQNYMTPVDR